MSMAFIAFIFSSYNTNAKKNNVHTRIEVNAKDNTVDVYISGKKIAFFDKDGLQVKGNIRYTGMIADAKNKENKQ